MQTGQSRFKILKVRQAGTVTRGGDFNRCHSCRPPSKALNSLRSGVPNAFVGEGMSKKLRPALTQMFAYLYLARVLNIFRCALGGITNKASVTRIFHEKKKKKFIFSQRFFWREVVRSDKQRDWVFEKTAWNSITSAVPLHGSSGAPACFQRL